MRLVYLINNQNILNPKPCIRNPKPQPKQPTATATKSQGSGFEDSARLALTLVHGFKLIPRTLCFKQLFIIDWVAVKELKLSCCFTKHIPPLMTTQRKFPNNNPAKSSPHLVPISNFFEKLYLMWQLAYRLVLDMGKLYRKQHVIDTCRFPYINDDLQGAACTIGSFTKRCWVGYRLLT